MRLNLASAVCLLGLIVSGLLAPQTAVAAPPTTPVNQVLVVTANLQEAFGDKDLRDLSEMTVFVDRVLAELGTRPDVLLLQEVRRKSAARVAALLTNRTGDQYAMAVAPPRRPVKTLSPRRSLHTDTGIVINTATMARASDPRFIATPYKYAHRRLTPRVIIKRHAYVLLTEKISGHRMPFTSVHYIHKRMLKSWTVQRYFNKWAVALAENVKARFPSDVAGSSIGGDFNHQRCRYEPEYNCQIEAPFYKTLTGTYDYTDSYRVATGMKNGLGVDFIFTHWTVDGAGKDKDYVPRLVEDDPTKYYSDHQFRWALISS